MPALEDILHAEPQLFSTNLERAIAFYTERLGLRLAFRHGEPAFYAQVVGGGARLNLRHVDGPVLAPGFREREADALAATLAVADAAGLFRRYAEAGLEFHQPLRREPWGAETFIVADPDGNLLAFAGAA